MIFQLFCSGTHSCRWGFASCFVGRFFFSFPWLWCYSECLHSVLQFPEVHLPHTPTLSKVSVTGLARLWIARAKLVMGRRGGVRVCARVCTESSFRKLAQAVTDQAKTWNAESTKTRARPYYWADTPLPLVWLDLQVCVWVFFGFFPPWFVS